jgi:hypothetical protein
MHLTRGISNFLLRQKFRGKNNQDQAYEQETTEILIDYLLTEHECAALLGLRSTLALEMHHLFTPSLHTRAEKD